MAKKPKETPKKRRGADLEDVLGEIDSFLEGGEGAASIRGLSKEKAAVRLKMPRFPKTKRKTITAAAATTSNNNNNDTNMHKYTNNNNNNNNNTDK